MAAGRVTTPPAAPAPSLAGASGPAEAPRLADGVELLGEYKNSGYGQPPSLVRRADGQVVQMSRLLYLVTCRIDGCRDPAAIAALVAEELGRALNDQVRYLITAKHLLIVLGLSVLSAAFHECGHAAGCRYGGARPGVIGVGIYLVWPAFLTNVTDSYRLSRAGRLRTDLGGLYFNPIFMLALAGTYSATSAEVLLLVIAITHLEMLEQLLPFVRFDGYFSLSDLAGVPDLFARIAPILHRAVPSRAVPKGRRDPRTSGLKRVARIVVTGWVLCVIPLLTLSIGYLLLNFAQINRALWRSASQQAHLLSLAVAGHRYAMAAVDAIGILLLALSLAGSLYILTGLARRLTALGLRWSAGRPARRRLVAVAGLACLTTLTTFWTVQGQFRGW